MAHKYYDDLADKKPDRTTCLFNTDEREQDSDGQDSDRQKRWDAQRSEYGFDDRETWSLDFTASTWLHSHLCMFKDIGGEIVDLNFHSFDIPVIKESPRYDKTQIPCYCFSVKGHECGQIRKDNF